MKVMRPKRPCNYAGCRNVTDKSYCDDHKHIKEQQDKERHKHYNTYIRDQELQKFYDNKAWRTTRLTRLQIDNYLCQHCLRNDKVTHADMVDHIIPIRVNWDKRLDIKNLQSLCDGCHAVKTVADKQIYRL